MTRASSTPATAKTHTGTPTTNNINTKTTKQSKNPRNKPLNPTAQTQNSRKQQKTAKNNKQQQKTANSTLGTKTLQHLSLAINIVNLPLNMLVPPRILLIPLQKLHPLASKHIAPFFPLKTNQISSSNLSQIPS
jgi:hypothetical protein